MEVLNKHIKEVKALCKKHKVSSLYLFGSATGKSFNKNSDMDFLVTFSGVELPEYFSNYTSLKESLKKLFHREIDLVEEQALKNPILVNSINKNKSLVYG